LERRTAIAAVFGDMIDGKNLFDRCGGELLRHGQVRPEMTVTGRTGPLRRGTLQPRD
jgi:hypothetical protein